MSRLDPDAMPPWLRTLGSTDRESLIAGPADDDCAVFATNEPCVIATTDFLNSRPIVLELGLGGLETAGRLLVASNLSDLLGSGATPRLVLASVMLRRDASRDDFHDLMRGVAAQCSEASVPLGGGDTKLGDGLVLCATAIGTARSADNLFLAKNARPGDRLWCSGPLGGVGAALRCFGEEAGPEGWRQEATRRVVEPRLPYSQSRALARTTFRKSGADLSDGLAADLNAVTVSSGAGFRVHPDRIPVDPFVTSVGAFFGLPPWAFCFCSGGDFQFVAAAGEEHDLAQFGLIEIGSVTDTPGLTIELGDRSVQLDPIGHRDAHGLTFRQEAAMNLDRLLGAMRAG